MINQLKITDNKFKTDVVDQMFVAVNINFNPLVHTEFNSEKAIVRYEFLEVMIRAALKKFIEFGNIKSEAEAINQFNEQYLIPYKAQIEATQPYYYD